MQGKHALKLLHTMQAELPGPGTKAQQHIGSGDSTITLEKRALQRKSGSFRPLKVAASTTSGKSFQDGHMTPSNLEVP